MGKKSPLDAHLAELLAWNDQGVERHEMASRLGVSKFAVQAYLNRRGVPAKIFGPGGTLNDDEVRRLIEVECKTQAEAAAILGCHTSSVERAVRRLGLQTPRTGPRSGADHTQWVDGRCIDKSGYVLVFAPLHPYASNMGRIREHRAICEVALDRYLAPCEVVDHKDDHPFHNWPSNLDVYSSNADHLRATLTERVKSSPRKSTPGVLPCNRTTNRCPEQHETLAQCPAETIEKYERFLLVHRPTKEHVALPKAAYLRSGAWSDPFGHKSTA